VLTRKAYVGRHQFNMRSAKTRQRKSDAEVVEMAVPPIIDAAAFEAVQSLLKARPDRAAHCQRTDTAEGHLLLLSLRQGDDAPDREGRQVQILHLLDQGPAGRDRLQGPDRSDGEAR
jgi:aminoglycoside/choline kinase family phosphotransferase